MASLDPQAPMYYRGANAAVIVYDITNPASFDDVRTWIEGEPATDSSFASAIADGASPSPVPISRATQECPHGPRHPHCGLQG